MKDSSKILAIFSSVLVSLASIATIIALIPEFGQWLSPRSPVSISETTPLPIQSTSTMFIQVVTVIVPVVNDPVTESQPMVLTTISPISTTAPTIIQDLFIHGNSQEGSLFKIPQAGVCNLSYSNGAYSRTPTNTYAATNNNTWLTGVYVYKNREIEWGPNESGLPAPTNYDYLFGDGKLSSTAQDAEILANDVTFRENILNLRLNSGEYIVVVAGDTKGYYGDNRGEVVFQISCIPST